MIASEPHVIERDGERELVDEQGAALVVRSENSSQRRMYHQADLEAYANGEIRPACRMCSHKPAGTWILRRKSALDGIWSECSFHSCFGGAESNLPREGNARSSEDTEYDRAAIAALARSQNAGNQHTAGQR